MSFHPKAPFSYISFKGDHLGILDLERLRIDRTFPTLTEPDGVSRGPDLIAHRADCALAQGKAWITGQSAVACRSKCLYVNRGFTSRFAGMTVEESLALLEYLWQHARRPELTCRYWWSNHEVVVWDNRCALITRSTIIMDIAARCTASRVHEEQTPA
jgi:hypothetical protein